MSITITFIIYGIYSIIVYYYHYNYMDIGDHVRKCLIMINVFFIHILVTYFFYRKKNEC